jgi:hypothetical protein
MTLTCPWCSAPRNTGPDCPRCGANYAKAEAIKAHGRAVPTVEQQPTPVESSRESRFFDVEDVPDAWAGVDDAELEWQFCLGAIPITLCIVLAFHASGLGSALQRIILTMPVHEFGHAVTAWFCGYAAIPTLWKTIIPDTRGFIAPLVLAGAMGYMMFRARLTQRMPVLYACGALLVVQAIATLGIKAETAQMLITFGGDGMGMVLATLLMASFFFGKNTQLYKGALRWGFVVIGAAAFVDIYATWWKSRKDEGAIPYGTTGGMATDAMKLVDEHGWTLQLLVHRYVVFGICCLIVLAIVYAWGVRNANSQRAARRLAQLRRERADRMAGRQ